MFAFIDAPCLNVPKLIHKKGKVYSNYKMIIINIYKHAL